VVNKCVVNCNRIECCVLKLNEEVGMLYIVLAEVS